MFAALPPQNAVRLGLTLGLFFETNGEALVWSTAFGAGQER